MRLTDPAWQQTDDPIDHDDIAWEARRYIAEREYAIAREQRYRELAEADDPGDDDGYFWGDAAAEVECTQEEFYRGAHDHPDDDDLHPWCDDAEADFGEGDEW